MTTGTHFIEKLGAAELHWFFVQAEQALNAELYIPACVSFINGIEASLRVTNHQLASKAVDDELGPTLSNSLLWQSRERGIPIAELAFPSEADFDAKIEKRQPYAEVVRIRHNLAHGNVMDYINQEYGVFTPECLRDLGAQLLKITNVWAESLGKFRADNLSY
ncbi:hypothetical protein DU490_00080 [Halomonas sp. DQ26W]|uniref:hypothetical protein n=1 Tax=Halomonas sp. DQ26W TaxID=2282311 RepID=UPI000DF7C180|nr:hypothetical protein [Halomonas sp. DQ26W]RDB44730.1 hypothetical protein DU490_00080 [Halomonas sp. DQ26W]